MTAICDFSALIMQRKGHQYKTEVRMGRFKGLQECQGYRTPFPYSSSITLLFISPQNHRRIVIHARNATPLIPVYSLRSPLRGLYITISHL